MTYPLFTVIYPGADTRGSVTKHLETWTAGQTLSCDRYRVVAVLQQEIESNSAIPRTPEATVVRVDAANAVDTAMWNAGAAVAKTPWLVFTEGHSLARPDCLEALDEWLASEPDVEAGNFEIGHPDNYTMARLSERWFGEQQARWRSQWSRLHRAGFVMRRDIFIKLGGFECYGQFSVPLLSARLHEAGYRIASVPGCGVTHLDDHTLYEHHFDTIDFVVGECDARTTNDPVFFERYFGHVAAWRNFKTGEPKFLRSVLRASLKYEPKSIAPTASKAAHLIRQTFAAGLQALSQSRLTLYLIRIQTKIEEAVLLLSPIPSELRYQWFVDAHRRVVRAAIRRCVQEHHRNLPDDDGAKLGRTVVSDLSPEALSGVHQLEMHDGHVFRWTGRLARIGLSSEVTPNKIYIDTGGLRENPDQQVVFAACGVDPLPPEDIGVSSGGTDLVVSLRGRYARASQEHGLTLCFRPLVPLREPPADPRELGLPIFAIEVS